MFKSKLIYIYNNEEKDNELNIRLTLLLGNSLE